MSTQPQDKMRAEFEATMRAEPHCWMNRDFHKSKTEGQTYADFCVEVAWKTWQAACAQQSEASATMAKIAEVAACFGAGWPDVEGEPEVLRRVKWAARQLKQQHNCDSTELRNLCAARDEARRARDLLTAENAALRVSVGHMSRLIDGQQSLLLSANSAMTALHNSASPVDESRGDLDARIPASDFRQFVDQHAALMHAIAQSPVAIATQGASNV